MSVRLVTLGRLAVYRDGEELYGLAAQPLPCALLAYLAVERRGNRDELTALLWPRRSPDAASKALSQTLYRLRRELGEDWVETHAAELRAAPHVAVDVHDFEEVVDTGDWERAIELYPGPFLRGAHRVESNAYDTWVERTRARLEAGFARATRSFVEDCLVRGDLGTALTAADRWVALDPYSELAQRTLIELLARAGHRVKALRQYERYEALLAEDLEVEPVAETKDLIRRVRAGEFSPAPVEAKPEPEPAPPPPTLPEGSPAARRRRARTGSAGPRWRRFVAPAVAGLLILAAITLLSRTGGPELDLATNEFRVAVIPFGTTSPDTALVRLGRDLVVTLSTGLDGLGGIRAIDPSAILAHAPADQPVLTEARARDLAAMLGATRFVHGQLLRTPMGVRLDLGVFATDEPGSHFRTSVNAPADDLMAVTDSVTWAIVQRLWQQGDPPIPSIAAATTRSARALDAFLAGEHALVEGRWMPAAAAFRRAFEIDPAFWLAYWRHAYASNWIGMPVDSSVIMTYVEYRAELPERERLLIEARRTSSLMARLAQGRRITERFPDYWLGWLELGDDLVHLGPFLGYEMDAARPFFERALALNMRLVGAWQHIVHFYIQDYDSAAVAAVIDTLDTLGAWAALEEGYGFDQRPRLLILDELRRTGRARPDVLQAYVRDLQTVADLYGVENAFGHLLAHDLPRGEIEVIERVRMLRPGSELMRESYRTEALAWAARGAWDQAVDAADEFTRRAVDGAEGEFAYRIATVGAWLGALDPDAARSRRAAAARHAATSAARAELAWLDGLLADASEDTAAFRRALESLPQTEAEAAAELERALRAFQLRRVDPARAAAALAALEWERADDPTRFGTLHPFFTSVNRLAAGRWLFESGNAAEASRILRFHDALIEGETAFYLANATLASLALLERARVDAVADTALAIKHYARFLQRYDRPVAAHQALVEQARAEMARLAGARNGG